MREQRNNRVSPLGPILALALLSSMASTASANFVGQDLNVSVDEINGANVTNYFNQTVTVVDPGLEVDGLFGGQFDIDIGANRVRIDINATGTFDPADFLGFQFTSPTVPLLGILEADSNIAGIEVSRFILQGNTFGLNLESLTVAPGDFVDVVLDVGAAPVPLPAAAWLLGSALVGLGLRGHRRGRYL